MTAEVPADSPCIIESKSQKHYMNSLSMSRFESAETLERRIADDLAGTAQADVNVRITPAASAGSDDFLTFPGHCIDYEAVSCDTYEIDASLLCTESAIVTETLHSHILRSLCPVTGQPDTGSLLISYRGPRIVRGSLLKYLVSFRQHSDFHELCVERIFCDRAARCRTDRLTVYARFNRRGGIDINPFRSNFEDPPANLRLWRQ
jgi:7-cyano-7-deazaguanine reductase